LDGNTRSAIIKKWIETKVVEVTKQTIYKKLALAKKDGVVSPFSVGGRPRYVDDEQIEIIAEELQTKEGKSLGLKELLGESS
jgi:transposase